MIEEHAVVVFEKNDYIWVETQKKSTCGSCSLKNGCGTGIMSTYFDKNSTAIQLKNTIKAKVGDMVAIGLNESALLLGSFLVYLLPLIITIIFAIIGTIMAKQLLMEQHEAFVIILSVIGFCFSMIIVKVFLQQSKRINRFQPTLLKKLQ